ncbi:MAG: CBS domain-containing protein [Pirellulales bacterium]|nr:CBS domain-containing protein [Pirellulales bacterium]
MDRPKLAKDIMVTKLVTLLPDKDVFKAMGLLFKNRISGAPVVDDQQKFLGVFSEKCCIRLLNDTVQPAGQGVDLGAKSVAANKHAKDVMVARLVTLRPESDVFQAIGYLLKHRVSGAPVVDEEHMFIGVFSERYCMSVLIDSAYEQLPTTAVSAFMDTDFGRTITEDTNLASIAQLFVDTHYRRLPVLREGKLVGQISRRDILLAAHKVSAIEEEREAARHYLRALRQARGVTSEDGEEPSLTVHAFMDSDAQTVTEETDLLSIAQIFLSTNYRRLPVLRDGRLVGQISRRDLLRVTNELLAIPPEQESSLLYLSSLMERHEAPIE